MNIEKIVELHEKRQDLGFEIYEIDQIINKCLTEKQNMKLTIDTLGEKPKYKEELVGTADYFQGIENIVGAIESNDGETFFLSDTETILMFTTLLSYKKQQRKLLGSELNKLKIEL